MIELADQLEGAFECMNAAVGEFEIAMLSDGLWRNDGGCMFGVVPRELWQRDHPADDRNRIRLNLTCPLIMRGGAAVLVDTGIGNL